MTDFGYISAIFSIFRRDGGMKIAEKITIL